MVNPWVVFSIAAIVMVGAFWWVVWHNRNKKL